LVSLILAVTLGSGQAKVGYKTTYDGVTPNQFNNSFHLFNGQSGISLSENQLMEMQSYTLSLWYRVQLPLQK
jgi:hypothetical protein